MAQCRDLINFCTSENGDYDFDISDSFKLVTLITTISSAFIQYKEVMINYMLKRSINNKDLNLTLFREGVEILTCFKEKPIPQIKILCLGISNMLMDFNIININS